MIDDEIVKDKEETGQGTQLQTSEQCEFDTIAIYDCMLSSVQCRAIVATVHLFEQVKVNSKSSQINLEMVKCNYHQTQSSF